MHMRKKKWSRPELSACPYYVADPAALRGAWASRFPVRQPLHLELGCGKGVSTAQMTHANPGVNYIAIDISPDVLGCARRNLENAYAPEEVTNVLLTRLDIGYINTFLAPEDRIERIYINFCNPWSLRPKHHKRRLTHPRQLMQYRQFLCEGGEIWFKTDDAQLFHDSQAYFTACGFTCVWRTEDLHQSGFTPNYVSEHEQKYTAEGIPIRFGIYRRLPGDWEMDAVAWRVWQTDEDEDDEDAPVCTVRRLIEEDFGCEGVPEGGEKQVTLIVQDENGALRRVRMSDAAALSRGICEGGTVRLLEDGSAFPV